MVSSQNKPLSPFIGPGANGCLDLHHGRAIAVCKESSGLFVTGCSFMNEAVNPLQRAAEAGSAISET